MFNSAEWDSILGQYKSMLLTSGRLSTRTCSEYLATLFDLASFVEDRFHVNSIHEIVGRHIHAYIGSLDELDLPYSRSAGSDCDSLLLCIRRAAVHDKDQSCV